jgi:Coenzyme PQQ synthesis protein D (PqqD)
LSIARRPTTLVEIAGAFYCWQAPAGDFGLLGIASSAKGQFSGKGNRMSLGEQVLAGVSVRSRKVVSRIVADEAIVVPIRGDSAQPSSVYTFNESGTTIWSMIEKGRSAADVAAYLESEYDISAEQAAEDTKQFLAELAEEGLIELA